MKNKQKDSMPKIISQTIFIGLFFMALFYLLFTFILSNDVVSGISMQPNFEDRDRVISVKHTEVKRNDIVILKAPHRALYIKRVIGMPGDRIKFKNDVLYINNQKTAEPYLTEGKRLYANGALYTSDFTLDKLQVTHGIAKVPQDSYFVMGDHRNVSRDSREIGYVSKDKIIGVVKLRYWPLQKITTY